MTPIPLSFCRPAPVALDRVEAARLAVAYNPRNAPRWAGSVPPTAARLAAVTGKYWGGNADLSVRFLDNPTAACRGLILSHMNAWGDQGAQIRFRETTAEGLIRITRDATGYWSVIGTDALGVQAGHATMNLGGWTEFMVDAECRRVIRHEAGHAIGMYHEQLRPEIIARLKFEETITWYMNTQGWTRDEVIANVLTPFPPEFSVGGPADVNSVMCYAIPGFLTVDGMAIPGGRDIDQLDYDLTRQLFPPSTSTVFTFDLGAGLPPVRRLMGLPVGWGVSAWTDRTIAFAQDFMVIPTVTKTDRPLITVPEPYRTAVGGGYKVSIDLAQKVVTTPPGWQFETGPGLYEPGKPLGDGTTNEKNVVVLRVLGRGTGIALLPSGQGWQSVM